MRLKSHPERNWICYVHAYDLGGLGAHIAVDTRNTRKALKVFLSEMKRLGRDIDPTTTVVSRGRSMELT